MRDSRDHFLAVLLIGFLFFIRFYELFPHLLKFLQYVRNFVIARIVDFKIKISFADFLGRFFQFIQGAHNAVGKRDNQNKINNNNDNRAQNGN